MSVVAGPTGRLVRRIVSAESGWFGREGFVRFVVRSSPRVPYHLSRSLCNRTPALSRSLSFPLSLSPKMDNNNNDKKHLPRTKTIHPPPKVPFLPYSSASDGAYATSLPGPYTTSVQSPWRPCGTACVSRTRATGPALTAAASNMTRDDVPVPAASELSAQPQPLH